MTRVMIVHDGTVGMADRVDRLSRAGADCALEIRASRDPLEVEQSGSDLILCLSPAYPKLWRMPSLLVLTGTDDSAFFDEKGLARLLSHDGWLSEHPQIETRLRDLAFGARKHRPYIGKWHEPVAGPHQGTTDHFCLSPSDRPGDLLARLLAGLPTAIGEDHPYAEDFAGMVPVISTDVPTAAIELQLAALTAAHRDETEQTRRAVASSHCRSHYSSAAQLKRLADELPRLTQERGFTGRRGAGNGKADWRVAFIVRAGGRPLSFLRRALAGLAAQGVNCLDVVLVLWRDLEGLEDLLSEYPNLHFKILRLPGADRSAALWAGLTTVREIGAAHFGVLDDDDEILPHHLTLLRAAIERTARAAVEPRPRIFYTAALHCSAKGFAAPPWLPSPCPDLTETIRLPAFQFYDPSSAAAHRHDIWPHCFLAETSLLDEEVLEDPRLPLAEDAYLFKLLGERSPSRFVPDVTAIAHDHGFGQSDFAVSPDTTSALERISLRMIGRNFPDPRPFSSGALPLAPHLLTTIPRRMTNRILRSEYRPLRLLPGVSGQTEPFATSGGDLEFSCIVHGRSELPISVSLSEAARERVLFSESGPIRDLAVPGLGEARIVFTLPDTRSLGALTARIVTPADVQLATIGVRAGGNGVKLAWSEIPTTMPLWLYGAGEAGHYASLALQEVGHPGPTRCIDGYKTGFFHGLQIERASALTATERTTILVASQYWRDIVADLRSRGFTGLYSSYPRLDRALLYLG